MESARLVARPLRRNQDRELAFQCSSAPPVSTQYELSQRPGVERTQARKRHLDDQTIGGRTIYRSASRNPTKQKDVCLVPYLLCWRDLETCGMTWEDLMEAAK